MSYCTRTDIEDRVGNQKLIDLTDAGNTGEVDDTKVSRAIEDADALIDSYAGSKYTVPFSPVPATIKRASISIAVYYLFENSGFDTESYKTERRAHDDALQLLKDAASGKVLLGSTAEAAAESDEDLPECSPTTTSDFRTYIEDHF